jgi:hypothetical protein
MKVTESEELYEYVASYKDGRTSVEDVHLGIDCHMS